MLYRQGHMDLPTSHCKEYLCDQTHRNPILDWEVPGFWMRNKEDRSDSWNQEVLHKQMTYPKQVD